VCDAILSVKNISVECYPVGKITQVFEDDHWLFKPINWVPKAP
jgi:hypothetical protein